MVDKDFKTIEEQLEILRSRSLTINDESWAKDFLLHAGFHPWKLYAQHDDHSQPVRPCKQDL